MLLHGRRFVSGLECPYSLDQLGQLLASHASMAFYFENLTVYQKSLDFVEQVTKLKQERDRKIPAAIMDQLFRAALSIPLNIAEGNGRWHQGDKRNFFWIARGSVFECVALIQVMKRGHFLHEDEYKTFYGRLEELSKMMTGLVQRFSDQKTMAD